MSSTMVAFGLRAGFDGDGPDRFTGGTVSLPAHALTDTFDVGEHLEVGDGVIVTDDPVLIGALDAYIALERVDPPHANPTRVSNEAPTSISVDPSVAGLSGAANAGLPVDQHGTPLPEAEPEPAPEPAPLDRDEISELGADDLRDLCRERGLQVSGTKQELIDRLAPEEVQ